MKIFSVAVGIELLVSLKTRKLLILRKSKTGKNQKNAGLRYTRGTRNSFRQLFGHPSQITEGLTPSRCIPLRRFFKGPRVPAAIAPSRGILCTQADLSRETTLHRESAIARTGS